ncbi:DUF6378 domain-containing protein [Acidovorax sp. A1169]|uniref:DUF6378 domain-containing protein n=1 Tax=Acidovorax sp. A1169 TaxID=3059524 RepID=UPI00273785BD|nr:DUF6378 domain-containing protein [Acidovorax sp. A1169]MDP4074227.1 DUF6378 domain-containing protein [Acidovorax sp. A1169]
MSKPNNTRKVAAPRARTTIARAVPGQAAPVAAAASNVTPLTAAIGPLLAQGVLRNAAEVITQRGAQRDTATGQATAPQERSMAATVAAFNAIHKTTLTETQGWAFMQTLKMVRAATSARNGLFNTDDYTDGAAYAALAHEAAESEAAVEATFRN